MNHGAIKILFLSALFLTGLLCGASLDQSFKQLPARRVIGLKAFSAYAKAADLRNGVIWYAILGIGAALTSLITAVLAWRDHSPEPYGLPLYLAGAFAILHSICTSIAAPTYHKQKRIGDEAGLRGLFDRFAFIQTIRSIFILLNFLSLIWALVIII
jgi:hypothetical protein